MPDRIIRDELLKSERWWKCSPQAQVLWLSIALSADDASRYSGSAFPLRTHCMAGTVDDAKIEQLLAELFAVDLLRHYTVGNVRYLFVPRFQQRKRYVKSSRYPSPPKEISDIPENKSDSSLTQDGPKTVSSQTEDGPKTRGVGVGVGVGVEEILSRSGVGVLPPPDEAAMRAKALLAAQKLASKFTSKPLEEIIQEDQKPKPNGALLPKPGWHTTDAGTDAAGKLLNLPALPGETYFDWRRRLFAAIGERTRGKT